MPHLLAQHAIEIDAPIGRVFDYAIDLEHLPDWLPGATSVEASDRSSVGTVGKRYREAVILPSGRKQIVTIQLKHAVRAQGFTTEGDLPWLLPRMEMKFHQTASDKTQVTWTMSSRREGLGLLLILPLLRMAVRARGRTGVRRLKAVLEKSVAST